MITTTYLQSDIINDGIPFLSPSNAPQQMTDTDEAINPILNYFQCCNSFLYRHSISVNNPISCPGIAKHIIVPTDIITSTRIKPS